MAQLRQNYRMFQAKGVQLAVIGMGDPSEARRFRQSRQLPFPLYSDTTQQVYRRYGLGTIGPQELAGGLRSASIFMQQLMRGDPGGMPVGDVAQLGGTFLIDKEGITRYVHRDQTSSAFPDMPTLSRVLQRL